MEYNNYSYKSLYVGPSYNYGFSLCDLPQSIYLEIEKTVNNFSQNIDQQENVGHWLAGHLDKEYKITLPSIFFDWLEGFTNKFHQSSNFLQKFINYKVDSSLNTPPITLSSGDHWINFQSKYEYNPMHTHTGVLSWVLWYKIPYSLENELNLGPGKFRASHIKPKTNNGTFHFIYPMGGNVATEILPVDNTWNGKIALFPSNLNHAVYPFYTSDDYRITIAGNINLI
jgi:hypothetical protein